MSIPFIIPLFFVALAIWIFKNSADEMAYLAAAVSLVGLVLSVILAPWQIKLLLLAIALLTSGKIWWPKKQAEIKPNFQLADAEPELENSTPQTEKQAQESTTQLVNLWAKMVYRGVNYEQGQHLAKVNHNETPRKYRGQIYQSSSGESPTFVQSHFELKYRGANVNAQKPVAPILEEQK